MLVIRRAQMDVLRTYMRGQFEQRMVKHLRERFPDRTQDCPDDSLRVVVRNSVKHAESYGIESEEDLRRFLEYVMIYGEQLDRREDTRWIGETLRRHDLDGTAKMDLLDSGELQALRA
jgi:hypothetical protein